MSQSLGNLAANPRMGCGASSREDILSQSSPGAAERFIFQNSCMFCCFFFFFFNRFLSFSVNLSVAIYMIQA